MNKTRAYVALGGNIGDSVSIFNQALREIAALPEIYDLRSSSFYQTTPVNVKDSALFLNAVCTFQTTLSAENLYQALARIETLLGKGPKEKWQSRIIDLDLLFFGIESIDTPEFKVPHLYWKERLFVLIPLSELVEELTIVGQGKEIKFSISKLLETFVNQNQEVVKFFTKPDVERS